MESLDSSKLAADLSVKANCGISIKSEPSGLERGKPTGVVVAIFVWWTTVD